MSLNPADAPHLLFLQQDVDGGQVLAIVVGLQLAVQADQPLVQVGAALGEQLRLVGVEQALGLGLGGRLQVLPHALQGRQLLFDHGLRLRLLCHQRLAVLKEDTLNEQKFCCYMNHTQHKTGFFTAAPDLLNMANAASFLCVLACSGANRYTVRG